MKYHYLAVFAILLLAPAAHAQAPSIPLVEPEQLSRDADLIGREIAVDDRVRFFQSHRGPGGKQVYDELILKRADVVFKLPPDLRPERPPREQVARVQGILQKEGRQVICEVQSLEMLPSDIERLDRELARLSPKEVVARQRWADWAAKRGRAFKDETLTERATQIETDLLLSEAERPGADLVVLAKTARTRRLGEPLSGALAQKGFRARLLTEKTSADLTKLSEAIDGFFPNASDPKVSKAAGLEEWQARYAIKPIDAYRQAPAPIRAAFDRNLLADVIQQRLERKLIEEPGKAIQLSEEARTSLSDRPEVSLRLRDRGLASTEAGVASMRLSEVEALAKTFREDGQAERARRLFEVWLEDQRRKRLNASDADGRVLLASHYERLLGDRATAVALLREAIRIDPNSRETADAFRRLGFKKSAEGDWVDFRAPAVAVSPAPSSSPAASQPAPVSVGEESLRGLSQAQVRSRFGSKPDKIVLSATQNETIEQWIYQRAKGTQIINFRRPRGSGRPQVISSYSLP